GSATSRSSSCGSSRRRGWWQSTRAQAPGSSPRMPVRPSRSTRRGSSRRTCVPRPVPAALSSCSTSSAPTRPCGSRRLWWRSAVVRWSCRDATSRPEPERRDHHHLERRSVEGREVVIVEAVRTPIGRGHPEKGYYKDVHPNELLGRTWVEVIERAGIPAEAVEDVLTGCVQQYGEQSYNIGRNAWLQAGLPIETPAT